MHNPEDHGRRAQSRLQSYIETDRHHHQMQVPLQPVNTAIRQPVREVARD